MKEILLPGIIALGIYNAPNSAKNKTLSPRRKTTMFEIEPLKRLVEDNQIMSFKHDGFWQCMDTLRDKQKLGEMLKNNKAPWKVWED